MIFSNPKILRNCNDIRVGGINVDIPELSYLNYTLRVETRFLKLVIEYIKLNMSEGATKEEAITETLNLVYSYIHIEESEREFPSTEEGIVKEILKSSQYKTWETLIYYRYMDVHEGKIESTTPISTGGRFNPNIKQDTINLMKEDQTLWVVLEGLASII
jgi:hypothetical protein